MTVAVFDLIILFISLSRLRIHMVSLNLRYRFIQPRASTRGIPSYAITMQFHCFRTWRMSFVVSIWMCRWILPNSICVCLCIIAQIDDVNAGISISSINRTYRIAYQTMNIDNFVYTFHLLHIFLSSWNARHFCSLHFICDDPWMIWIISMAEKKVPICKRKMKNVNLTKFDSLHCEYLSLLCKLGML